MKHPTFVIIPGLLVIASMLVVVACSSPPQRYIDQAKRNRYFMACLTNLPSGPNSTEYNDWDDVVKACDEVASRQSVTEVKCETCVQR